jgi:two-component system LytT family sensor kinase
MDSLSHELPTRIPRRRETAAEAAEAPQPHRRRSWWALVFAWWTLNGFASATFYRRMRDEAGLQPSWGHALATTLTSAWLWVPITLLALWLAARFPLERGRWGRHLPVHLAATAAVVLGRAAVVVLCNRWIGWYQDGLPPLSEILITSVENNLFLYWLVTGVAHAAHFYQSARRRERQLAHAQLHALKAQIQPHFLFNTLHSISSLVRHDPDRAERMIARLSELLRHTLAAASAQEVALGDELKSLEPYLEIEQARFEDRLRVRWRVDPAALDACVPHLILQPLVENAVRHGLSRRAAPGTLEIAAAREGAVLRLHVRDDGVGVPAGFAWRAAAGVGLANVAARLEQIHGGRHRFELARADGGGAVASIEIPYRRCGSAAPANREGGR